MAKPHGSVRIGPISLFTLIIVLRIQNNTYTIEQWKVTTEWTDDGTGENLWLG